jgi:hypothetical protein
MRHRGHRLLSPRVAAAPGLGPCWRGATVEGLLAAIAAGRSEPLGELFRRHDRPAVAVALRLLLDAGADEHATFLLVRSAAIYALANQGACMPGARRTSAARCEDRTKVHPRPAHPRVWEQT